MADIKFSCGHCGQHISCDQAWSGHQLQCPACQTSLVVPSLQAPSEAAAAEPSKLVPQPPAAGRHKLSAGATQVTRPTPTGPLPQKRSAPRPPKAQNLPLKYTAIAVLLLVLGVVAYNYVPGLLNQVPDVGLGSKTTGSGTAPAGGGLGPMGEVNGAMDVSDTLDGNSASRPRSRVARSPATPATNVPAKSATSPGRKN